jgi:hypothetical protein
LGGCGFCLALGAEFLALLAAIFDDSAAGFVELVFGFREKALGALVLAMVGFGPVDHFELEEGI